MWEKCFKMVHWEIVFMLKVFFGCSMRGGYANASREEANER